MSESVKPELPEPAAPRQVGWLTQAGNVVTPAGNREQDARLYGWKPVYELPDADQLTAAHAAGVRAGMLRAAQIAESERVDAAATGEETDVAYNAACEHIAAAIRSEAEREGEK
jgi:hypothetical protein